VDLAFISSRTCGVEKQLSSPYSQELFSMAHDKDALCRITQTLPSLMSIGTQVFLEWSRIGASISCCIPRLIILFENLSLREREIKCYGVQHIVTNLK
jgi:hypothetical protein